MKNKVTKKLFCAVLATTVVLTPMTIIGSENIFGIKDGSQSGTAAEGEAVAPDTKAANETAGVLSPIDGTAADNTEAGTPDANTGNNGEDTQIPADGTNTGNSGSVTTPDANQGAVTPEQGTQPTPDNGGAVNPVPNPEPQKPATSTAVSALTQQKASDEAAKREEEIAKAQEEAEKGSYMASNIHVGKDFYVGALKETYGITFAENFVDIMEQIEQEYRASATQTSTTAGEAPVQAESSDTTKVPEKAPETAVTAKKTEDTAPVSASPKKKRKVTALSDSVKTGLLTEESIGEIAEEVEAQAAETPVADTPEDTTAVDGTVKEIKDATTATNWQDIFAVYVMQQNKAGVVEYVFDENSKAALADIFAQMTQPVQSETEMTYNELHVADYIAAHQAELTEEDVAVLNRYVSNDCSLLCTATTSASGLINQSTGDITETRKKIVEAAYDLVGQISYFWGGKSTAIGWDETWGTPQEVVSDGSKSSGTVRSFGLDCSGYVTWAFVNGYEDAKAAKKIGNGTASQWEASEPVEEKDALPGDLVFLRVPDQAGINHIGIVVGKSDAGDLIVAHCNASDNGVVIEAAHSVGFKYLRRPKALVKADTELELQKLQTEAQQQ